MSVSKIVMFFLALVTFGVFLVYGKAELDPDFGWHFMTGKYIFEHQKLPSSDPFSYTMSSYPYIDHAWLSDVFWFVIADSYGTTSLVFLYSAVAVLTIFIALYPDYCIESVLAIFLAAPMLLLRFGLKTQVIDWLLFAIFLQALFSKNYKKNYVLVFILLLWANLHGGFVVGLAIWALYICIDQIKKKALDCKSVCWWVLGLGVTFVNPYGIGLWREVLMTLWGSTLAIYVSEWMPAFYTFEPAFLFSSILIICVVWKVRNKVECWIFLLTFLLTFEAFINQRHVALFAVFFLFCWPKVLSVFVQNFLNSGLKIGRAKFFYGLLVCIGAMIFFVTMFNYLHTSINLKDNNFYPESAVLYLQNHPFAGNLFSAYGWGGYLIWHYPEKKVFIDGRMPIWRRNTNFTSEANSAFEEFLDISVNGNYQVYFSRYDIQTVLWPRASVGVTKSSRDVLPQFLLSLFHYREPVDFASLLEDAGWKRVYEDQIAVIYSLKNK